MKTFEYEALAFRQQPEAPLQVAFVAFAADVLEWSGIPRKSDELLTGYQRFRDRKRIDQEIVPFFENQQNCSPTAVIVALRPDSGLGRCTLEPSDVPVGQVLKTILRIQVDDTALGTERALEAALQYVTPRLNQSKPPAEADEDADQEEANDDESEAEEDEDIHLGSVTLARMKELLEDRSNWANANFKDAVADYVKPAFLIDGQHRISAAAKFGKAGLPFMVCGLFGPAWEEQVFQFTVVNLKPKRIPPALITSIAGLSLTRTEQDRVETRLQQAGVKMTEVTIMSLVAYDDASPFVDMIDMAVAAPEVRSELLGFGGMKRIAKEWYRASRKSLAQIARGVFNTNSLSRARHKWRSERVWFDFFSAFWSAVRDHWQPQLWQKTQHNKLMVTADLWALQEVILREADGQVASHWKLPADVTDVDQRATLLTAKLLEVVTATLAYFPEEMWTAHWQKGSQDTTAGRSDLVELFKRFVDEGAKSGKVWKTWRDDPWFGDGHKKEASKQDS